MRIRKVKTASGSTAVQVVSYRGYKTRVLKHIGSVKDKSDAVSLENLARDFIARSSGQFSLFPSNNNESGGVFLDKYKYLGFRYGFAYEVINNIFGILGLDNIDGKSSKMFLDLSLMRVIEPASKRMSVRLLSSFFGIDYSLTEVYRSLTKFSEFKDLVEDRLINFARRQLGFDFNFVLYDITTLYFETFTNDDFRKRGFSKDNKIGQPQILVGLIVSKEGFPLSFAVFEGSKFEGHTLIPTILDFKEKHKISTLTVVADAGMLSTGNILALKQSGLSYIVGARLGNSSPAMVAQISQSLNSIDGATTRLKTDNGFLVCSFSSKRYAKDKHEMEKQLEKANLILDGKKEIKRNKFVSKNNHIKYSLNNNLV
ncbi:MAG: IS1634 family transposase, partial [Patescibacteria group bacterium]